MARALVNLALILTAFLIQNSVFPMIPFLSAAPNLPLILIFSFGFIEGKRPGMLYGFLAGVLLDLFYGGPLGFHALFYVYVGCVNGIFADYFYDDYITLPLVLSAANELAYNLYVYVFRFMFRGRLDFLYYLRTIIIPETIFTVVATLFLYRLLLYVDRRLKEYESRRDTTLV